MIKNWGKMSNNGSGTIDINKLLEERGKIHGDPETTHTLAYRLFKMLDDCQDNKLKTASRAMLFLICVKLARCIQNPAHADHLTDVSGYAELIKRVECG